MALTLPISSACIVLDANAMVALCAKEPLRYATIKAEIEGYAQAGNLFYAPNIIVGETLYALRRKLTEGALSDTEHLQAAQSLLIRVAAVLPPPRGEASLILRAEQICLGYGASRSADALYIALAKELSQTSPTRLLTFDRDLPKQAARHAASVNIHLLT